MFFLMKHYHALIVFALLVMPSVFFSWQNVQAVKKEISMDMSQALAKALDEQETFEITPDTIQNYCQHLQMEGLKGHSFVCYAREDEQNLLCSKKYAKKRGDKVYQYQCYASCSFATIWGMSDQRMPLAFLLLSLLWGVVSSVYFKRQKNVRICSLGQLSYSAEEGHFYDKKNQQIYLTPMQEQLMKMFVSSENLTLSKQDICATLWPKKPDASDTLYTLIKRIKPIVEERFGMKIVSDRGRNYSLVDKE